MRRSVRLLLVLTLCLPTLANTLLTPAASNAANMHAANIALQVDQGNPEVKVWVNTNSGVYHCPGTRWYGKTKNGTYMTQAEAQKKGYRPAYGRVCR
jgi:hypothetical protein